MATILGSIDMHHAYIAIYILSPPQLYASMPHTKGLGYYVLLLSCMLCCRQAKINLLTSYSYYLAIPLKMNRLS